MQQLENDLDQTQEKLMNANQRLEEKEKALQNVSHQDILTMIINCHFFLFSYSRTTKKTHQNGTNRGQLTSLFPRLNLKSKTKFGHKPC